MSLLDEFIDRTKTVADIASKKTENFIDVSKLKIKENDISRKIDEEYKILGKLVYDKSKNNEPLGEIVKENYNNIEKLNDELEQLKKDINNAEDTIICPRCNTKNKSTFTFCCKCGEKLN